jgi:hypothetical protein
MDETNAALLRTVFWDMTVIDHWTEEIEHPDTDANDDEDDSWTERILHITVIGKTADEMAVQYGFTDEQKALLGELLSGEYDDLFAALLSGAAATPGENIVVVENGIYIWPSPVSSYVTSFFGNRPNPTTGAPDNHTGIDITKYACCHQNSFARLMAIFALLLLLRAVNIGYSSSSIIERYRKGFIPNDSLNNFEK